MCLNEFSSSIIAVHLSHLQVIEKYLFMTSWDRFLINSSRTLIISATFGAWSIPLTYFPGIFYEVCTLDVLEQFRLQKFLFFFLRLLSQSQKKGQGSKTICLYPLRRPEMKALSLLRFRVTTQILRSLLSRQLKRQHCFYEHTQSRSKGISF